MLIYVLTMRFIIITICADAGRIAINRRIDVIRHARFNHERKMFY